MARYGPDHGPHWSSYVLSLSSASVLDMASWMASCILSAIARVWLSELRLGQPLLLRPKYPPPTKTIQIYEDNYSLHSSSMVLSIFVLSHRQECFVVKRTGYINKCARVRVCVCARARVWFNGQDGEYKMHRVAQLISDGKHIN